MTTLPERPELPPGWTIAEKGGDFWLCHAGNDGRAVYVAANSDRGAMVRMAWKRFAETSPTWAKYLDAVAAMLPSPPKFGPLPDVDTLHKWMRDETSVYLTFDRGEGMIKRGDLPASRSVGKAWIMEVNTGCATIDIDGYQWVFCFRAEAAGPMLPVLTSIGPRRDTVQIPPERPWVKAIDTIVETWIGREIELTAAHTAPWPARLRSVGFAELLVDYNDHGDVVIQRIPREHTDVRLAEAP
jgi:hypothetical protein